MLKLILVKSILLEQQQVIDDMSNYKETINTRKDLIAFKRKLTMAKNAGVDAFVFRDRTYLLSVAETKVVLATERLT